MKLIGESVTTTRGAGATMTTSAAAAAMQAQTLAQARAVQAALTAAVVLLVAVVQAIHGDEEDLSSFKEGARTGGLEQAPQARWKAAREQVNTEDFECRTLICCGFSAFSTPL